MPSVANRVAVLHGVNFDVLERRDPAIYGGLSLSQLEAQISTWAHELQLEPIFFQTNAEGEFCEYLHRSADLADAAIVNAGAWTHYSRAIADALELTRLPAVEVHLSDVEARDDWRRLSVFDGLVLAKISGKGPDGYREALERLAGELGVGVLMRGRGDRLEALLAERELDRMLVTDLTNVRYLTGFTGTNGACVCGPGLRLFFTDFRYTERAAAEVEGWEALTIGDDWLKGIAEHLEGRVGFEDDQMAVRTLEKLKEKLAEGTELVAAGGRVEELRRVKDADELAKIAEAAEARRRGLGWALEQGFAGRTERDVARATEARIRELGADPSFPAIVAAGPNGALPHAEPGEREIGRGELVVFDMGAQLDGYCSDGTRTFATGEPGERRGGARRLRGGAAGPAGRRSRRSKPGSRARTSTAPPASVIDDAGHGEHFGHALGHGVGLEVHEGPRLSPALRRRPRSPGEVVTVEPGIYLPGSLGVRIEDLVVVTEDGLRNLSSLPKELQLVG